MKIKKNKKYNKKAWFSSKLFNYEFPYFILKKYKLNQIKIIKDRIIIKNKEMK